MKKIPEQHYKIIKYAYPTSITAGDFNCYKTGCYIVSVYTNGERLKTISNKVFVLKEPKSLDSVFAKEICEYVDSLDAKWDENYFNGLDIKSAREFLVHVGFK